MNCVCRKTISTWNTAYLCRRKIKKSVHCVSLFSDYRGEDHANEHQHTGDRNLDGAWNDQIPIHHSYVSVIINMISMQIKHLKHTYSPACLFLNIHQINVGCLDYYFHSTTQIHCNIEIVHVISTNYHKNTNKEIRCYFLKMKNLLGKQD